MSHSSTRIYTQRYNARKHDKDIHEHRVTTVVECLCGCVQEELFPPDVAVADDFRCAPEDVAAGRVARDRLGYRSMGSGVSDDAEARAIADYARRRGTMW